MHLPLHPSLAKSGTFVDCAARHEACFTPAGGCVFEETKTSQHWVLTSQSGHLSYEHVLAEAGETRDTQASTSCSRLRADRGVRYYSELLFALTHRRYEASEAEQLWSRILQHRDRLSLQLGRNPGVAVAALDHLTNVEGCLARPTLIEELKLARLVESATRDSLTGLYDRESLRLSLERAFAHGAEPVTLIMIDLDHFKRINDVHGHVAGDRVLVRIADMVRQSVRDTDVAARYGGEELCLLLPGRSLDDGVAVAERLRARIEAELADQGVTVSLGVASFPRDARDPVGLIQAADAALYVSKRTGRNRVSVHEV